MCTLVILRRPDHDWPLVVGANRDEMETRPWRPPGRYWPDRPDVVAGLDETAGGSWLGLNDHGVMAAVLNRVGTLGPLQGKRSRGELVLEALDHADAVDGATALGDLDVRAYRPFNVVVADNRDAFWIAHRGGPRPEIIPLPEGLSILTARELNDPTSPRIMRYLERFRAATAPEPERDDWAAWQELLSDTVAGDGFGPESAMSFRVASGFRTVSSSLIALPAAPLGRKPEWRFATVAGQVSGWSEVRLG